MRESCDVEMSRLAVFGSSMLCIYCVCYRKNMDLHNVWGCGDGAMNCEVMGICGGKAQ